MFSFCNRRTRELSNLFKAYQFWSQIWHFPPNKLCFSMVPNNSCKLTTEGGSLEFFRDCDKADREIVSELRVKEGLSPEFLTVVNDQVHRLTVWVQNFRFPWNNGICPSLHGSLNLVENSSCSHLSHLLPKALSSLPRRLSLQSYHSFTPQRLRNIRRGRVMLFYLDLIITLKSLLQRLG